MPRYDVYIPFTSSYEGEPYDEEFSIVVVADNDKDAIKKAIEELQSEYVVKTIDSREITVEEIPDFPSFDDWEEKYTARNNPFAQEGEQGLGEIMFDTDEKGVFAGFTNEASFAVSLNSEIGVLTNDVLLNYQNFQSSGMVIKKSTFESNGGLKPSIKLNIDCYKRVI